MAVVAVGFATAGGGGGEEVVDVRITPRAEQIMASPPKLGGPAKTRRQGVGDHRHHGAHVGEAGPEAVKGGEVGRVQLSGSAGPEVFGVVGGGEGVEVYDLGAVGGGDSEDGFAGEGEGEAGARGQGLPALERAGREADGGVEVAVDEEGGGGRGGEVGGRRVRTGRARARIALIVLVCIGRLLCALLG